MKAVAMIQARMGSKRFPGKVLAELHGQAVLKHVIDRVSAAETVGDVIVATCMEKGPGGAIVGRCMEWDVRCFIGYSENDVLQRLALAARHEDNLIVRVCGDNPLIWTEGIDALVKHAEETRADYCGYELRRNVPAIKQGTGYFAEVVTREALKRADRETPPDDPRREHVTSIMYEQPHKYKCRWVRVPEWIAKLPHAAIDTPEDLERVTEIMEASHVQG